MSNNERYVWKGQLADAKNKLKQKQLEISSLVFNLRMYLNPYEDDMAALQDQQIEMAAKQLGACIRELRELKEKIANLLTALEN